MSQGNPDERSRPAYLQSVPDLAKAICPVRGHGRFFQLEPWALANWALFGAYVDAKGKPQTDHRAHLVYLALASCAGKDETTVWPSRRELSLRTGISQETVEKMLIRLEVNKFIRIIRSHHRQRPWEYEFLEHLAMLMIPDIKGVRPDRTPKPVDRLDYSGWSARDLVQHFVFCATTRLEAGYTKRMVGSAGIVGRNVRAQLSRGVKPDVLKECIDQFTMSPDSYCRETQTQAIGFSNTINTTLKTVLRLRDERDPDRYKDTYYDSLSESDKDWAGKPLRPPAEQRTTEDLTGRRRAASVARTIAKKTAINEDNLARRDPAAARGDAVNRRLAAEAAGGVVPSDRKPRSTPITQ